MNPNLSRKILKGALIQAAEQIGFLAGQAFGRYVQNTAQFEPRQTMNVPDNVTYFGDRSRKK